MVGRVSACRACGGRLAVTMADLGMQPASNAFIESPNGKFRAECLNTHWFMSLDEARGKCEAWRRDYNEVRPHSSIGNEVPAALHRAPRNPGQPVAR